MSNNKQTPKEKAEELLDKMTMEIGKFNAKLCALIAVDEILETVVVYDDISKDYQFWQQVKQEIEKL
jgi:hypothetical protein